jgi:hypothetical protein
MRESKIAMRAELERLMSECDIPVRRDRDHVPMTCTRCKHRKLVNTRHMQLGIVCQRCGAALRPA